ncbi:MAG: hypothetical protein SAK29_30635 [Scytonema sp. PMC 1069.18]|nr:hypothetical protein [Scytonema sp. PMC 1069.18]MEC4882481.1 hypothetical protein [Scytonema sp. PMC 1070.18]
MLRTASAYDKAWGATGEISFIHDGSLHGDRKEDLVQSAKVIRSQCSNSSPIFVPLEYEQNYACPKSVKARNP